MPQNSDNAQEFLNEISNYEYFSKDGLFDLESFCVHLSACFANDGILNLSPQPRDIYDLLLYCIQTDPNLGGEALQKHVLAQELTNWTTDDAFVYPDRYRTCITISALTFTHSHWVASIGYDLMNLPEPKEPAHAAAWIKPEWIFVKTFIEGFLTSYWDFIKDNDKQSTKEKGYSLLEALHKAHSNEIDYDQAIKSLKQRHEAQQKALQQIQKAIDEEFFLEAITLQECFISNCLYNYLVMQGKNNLEDASFHKLLTQIGKGFNHGQYLKSDFDSRINDWRKDRNKAIHGFITSKIDELTTAKANFDGFSKETALQGAALCSDIEKWYENEAVNYATPTHEIADDLQLSS
ncbi:MAG: hypothetical protein OXE99_15220 [Cellvibrionales bacterium]|nr:hypothetical protein [Cellvibrionales bacterium]